MALPIKQVVRPSSLSGISNGRIPATSLVSVPGQAGGVSITLVKPADRAWRALQDAALKAGHVLKTSWATNSYRPYADQERIFLDRYRTWPKYSGQSGKWWQGRVWYLHFGATAAVPGTSNHGWGLAIDLGEERDGDGEAESVDQDTVNWLVANELRFGWSHELQSEPWHIHYYAGDNIPKAVLDFEQGNQQQEEDDMPKPLLLRLSSKDAAVLYLSSARTVHWVSSIEALAGYKEDMKNNGLDDAVCVLNETTLKNLKNFVTSLPFIGDWPKINGASTGTKEVWKGAYFPTHPKG